MLPLFFPVQKNLQLPVQVPMGFLTRPVTGYETCHGARDDEYAEYNERSLHHISVPLVWPRYSAIAIALMNMPVMM